MTYPVACTDADRIPTHCGTFIDPTPAPRLLPAEPDNDEAAEEAIDRTPFGGPLFDNFLGGSLD